MISSALLFNGAMLATATMMTGDETCAWHKKLYPKEAVQFPTPKSGRVSKSCEWTCGELTFDALNDTNNCEYSCTLQGGTPGSGFIKVLDGFKLVEGSGHKSDCTNANGKNLGLVVKLNRMNTQFKSARARPAPGSEEEITIEVNVTKVACDLKPIIADVAPDRMPFSEATYDTWDSNESFKLDWDATTKKFTITAKEIFGAYHAMSTIENMIEGVSKEAFDAAIGGDNSRIRDIHQGDDIEYGIPFADFSMTDMPKYPYRGLMIDTARSYLPVNKIKEVIDIMALSKMNVVHWHATDDQSFPLALGTRKLYTAADTFTNVVITANTVANPVGKNVNVTDWIHGPDCNASILNAVKQSNCAGLVAPGAYYDRTDIADIYTYAWLKGINVLMEVDSPSHARSWGSGQLETCEKAKWDGAVNADYGVACPAELSLRDGPTSQMGVMCHGMKYQQDEYCMQQLCGPLNFQLTEASYVPDATKEFANQFGINTFKGITAALDFLVDDELDNGDYINVYKSLGTDAVNKDPNATGLKIFEKKKLIDAGESFHIGLDEALPTCLDGVGGGKAKTSSSISHWIDELVKDVKSTHKWIPHAWHDALDHYPELQPTMVANDVVPQFWYQAGTGTWNIMEWATNGFVWSPNEIAYLDCGLGNNAVAGFDSYCRPWKNFWHVYNLDPERHTGFASANEKRLAANPPLEKIRAKGNEVALWGELGTVQNVIPRAFPRATAAGGAAWSGRDRIPAFDNNLAVLDTYDFSSIDSKDFEDEYEWVAFGYNLAHQCHEIMPEKTVFCSMNPHIQDHFCKHFGKAVYDTEATRSPAPTSTAAPEAGNYDFEAAFAEQKTLIENISVSSGMVTAAMVFGLLAFLAAAVSAFCGFKVSKQTKVLGTAEVTYIDVN